MSVGLLRDAAERAGGRVVDRLAEVHAMLGADMAVVDQELARLVRDGLSPATESATHLLEAGGKRVRPLTVLLSAACFGPPPAPARGLAVGAAAPPPRGASGATPSASWPAPCS